MTDRYMIDDAGTLIDIETREMYDIVEEVVDVLNTQNETITNLNHENSKLLQANLKLTHENTTILQNIRQAYQTERTSLGRNVLKQLLESLE